MSSPKIRRRSRYAMVARRALACALLTIAATLFFAASAGAAPPTGAPPSAPPAASPSSPPGDPASEIDARRVRTEQILALLDGTLDPSVDAPSLFVLSLDDPSLVGIDGASLAAIIERAALANPDGGAAPPDLDQLQALEPAEALSEVLGLFLALPRARRVELLDAHRAKRELALAQQDAERRAAIELAELDARATQLEAYLTQTLDPEVDVDALLRVDLADPDELALSERRRDAWLSDPSSPQTNPAYPTPDPNPTAEFDPASEALVEARAGVDALRKRYLRLPAAKREALAAAHARQVEAREAGFLAPAIEDQPDPMREIAEDVSQAESEAEQAAAAREQALRAARDASTEARRAIAQEKARLLGVLEAQALFEAEVTRRKAARAENHEKALEWKRRVDELATSPKFSSEKAAEADPLYDDLRTDLTTMRAALRAELPRVRKVGENVPSAGDDRDLDLPRDIDLSDLTEVREQVAANYVELSDLERTVSWELAAGLRDDVVLMNRTRLALLELASPRLRASVTGFGPSGVDQVKRELDQISVELSFHGLRLFNYRRNISESLRNATIPLILGTVQMVLILGAYLWWRRHGDRLLDQLEQGVRERRPSFPAQAAVATTIWYFRRVRRPLEILLILWVLFRQLDNVAEFPELNLLWITARWVLLGLAAIAVIDALATRETQFSAERLDTSALRIHSLRLVGLNVVAVGLLLSLTSAMVGKGAIYSWVISTCWLLSFPVVVYLVYKWRPVIFQRVEARTEQNGFSRWASARKEGMVSFPVAALTAGYLLVGGLAAWTMRQLSGLEATRRLLAYMFRREVAKQAAATEADERYTAISDEIGQHFAPEVVPPELLAKVAGAELESVAALAAHPRATLSAIVGERGSGRSTFLRRLATRLDDEVTIRVVSCPEEGVDALLAELAALTGQPEARGEALSLALRELSPAVIAIDDLQRLVVPAVNGMRGLDEFIKVIRVVGANISWVVTFGSASWHYVRRARGESVFFEQIVDLPRWSEDELGDLIRAQCEAAGIAPSFDGLVVPRQAAAPLPNGGDRTEAGYFRLLWDFSDGNPAVALYAFRHSLFTTAAGKLVVRLFNEPAHEQIEDLSLSILFVLRTVVQLDVAQIEEVEAATQLARADVEDALRFCLSRGYLETTDSGVRIAWPWYRTITTVLRRQHLLSKL